MKNILLLLSLFFAFTNAQASDYWNSNQNNTVVVDVVDDNGRILNQHTANNNRYKAERSYLEAIKGKRYKIRLRNTSNRRVGVVVAVDGRNILNGKKSYLRSNEKMYVLDPYESADYVGWRTAKNSVNRFYFTSAGNSYSDAWGDRSAMGVIAVAVFDEKYKRRYKNKKRYKHSAPSSRGYLSDESTGTGFGREEYSPTTNVSFKAKKRPILKRFIKYEWRATLCKRGIVDCENYNNDYRENNRFWPREANSGYAPYPPGHRRNGHKNRHRNRHNNSQTNTIPQWSDQFMTSWDTTYERGW